MYNRKVNVWEQSVHFTRVFFYRYPKMYCKKEGYYIWRRSLETEYIL